jgi:hypothetical protein
MSWTREQLLRLTLSRIDEVTSESNQVSAIDPNLVEQELDHGAVNALLKAPKEVVMPAATDHSMDPCLLWYKSVVAEGENPYYNVIIPLSNTFLRFLRVRLHGWSQNVDKLISVESAEYRRQNNTYLMATVNRPAAAIVPFGFSYSYAETATKNKEITTVQAIEVFPPPSELTSYDVVPDDDIEEAIKTKANSMSHYAVFNANPTGGKVKLVQELLIVDSMTAEKLPDRLIDATTWFAASYCLASLREANMAKIAEQKAIDALKQLVG